MERKTEGYVWAGGSKSRLTAPEKRSCLQRLKLIFAGITKIKEAAVVGVTDETLGNRICAFLVTDDEAGIDLQEIHRFLREIGVAAYKMPDQIERVETWPLTSVGKIDKKALERMAQEK